MNNHLKNCARRSVDSILRETRRIYKEYNNRTDPSRQIYFCPMCGKAYTRPDTLGRHVKYECHKAPQFICPVCNKASTQKSNLQRHCRTMHGIKLLNNKRTKVKMNLMTGNIGLHDNIK
uniref:Lola_16 protein n=1 Tax=Fopius arisanus TaxID=64838 RepID=A0A0C9R478_9HYME